MLEARFFAGEARITFYTHYHGYQYQGLVTTSYSIVKTTTKLEEESLKYFDFRKVSSKRKYLPYHIASLF